MSDLTVSPGYATIEEEFEASLRRAFVDGKANYLWVDSAREPPYLWVYSARERFRIESAAYGVERGWLEADLVEVHAHFSYVMWTLTDFGKKHFGLAYSS